MFFYPNRPLLLSIDHPKIDEMDKSPDWHAEIKKNGMRLCLHHTEHERAFDNFVFWERKKKILKYEPLKEVLDELKSLGLPMHTHIDAEFRHNKVKGIKHLIYIYDLYVFGGKMVTDTLDLRRERLLEILKGRKYNHLEIAPTYPNGFKELFKKEIVNPEHEGLVLKDRRGKIVFDTKKSVDCAWQYKVRRPNKNYKF